MNGERRPRNEEVEILIVEDSPTQAEQLRHILEKNEYRVLTAGNGKEALDLINRQRPMVIISDIIMPEIDGYELCKKIKSDENLKEIAVILLTSLSDPKDVVKGLECGADNFITKPYEERYLISRIQYILANWDLRQKEKIQMGVEIFFSGQKYYITSDRLQILNLLLSTYETAVQKNLELTKIQDELKGLNEHLEEEVERRTSALKEEINVRKQVEEELKSYRDHLEDLVKERTIQLEAANKELEAFSYSVSHDLRAPLRSIDGFSRALLEEYVDKLDVQGKDYLGRICAASQRMAQLIDDLLNLSHITRSGIRRERVDLSRLSQMIASELQKTQPERRVESVIAEGIIADGDAHLLRIALENLLGNAWKFTSKASYPRIEFGMIEHQGKPAYFVRDNGAGFDMAYADKLFGVFQRLHLSTEFPGTGIGLAIVERIIQKHGGRIWAEGKVDGGAAFYFTLHKEVRS